MYKIKNCNGLLRIHRKNRAYNLLDVLQKIWICKAVGNYSGLWLPKILIDKTIILRECNTDGVLISDGLIFERYITKEGCILGAVAFSKRFRISIKRGKRK